MNKQKSDYFIFKMHIHILHLHINTYIVIVKTVVIPGYKYVQECYRNIRLQ